MDVRADATRCQAMIGALPADISDYSSLSPLKFPTPNIHSPYYQKLSVTMPTVSNRLSKVQKQITKKKGKNAILHEGSRDTMRLQRAGARDDKINRLAAVREKQNRPYCMSSFQSSPGVVKF